MDAPAPARARAHDRAAAVARVARAAPQRGRTTAIEAIEAIEAIDAIEARVALMHHPRPTRQLTVNPDAQSWFAEAEGLSTRLEDNIKRIIPER